MRRSCHGRVARLSRRSAHEQPVGQGSRRRRHAEGARVIALSERARKLVVPMIPDGGGWSAAQSGQRATCRRSSGRSCGRCCSPEPSVAGSCGSHSTGGSGAGLVRASVKASGKPSVTSSDTGVEQHEGCGQQAAPDACPGPPQPPAVIHRDSLPSSRHPPAPSSAAARSGGSARSHRPSRWPRWYRCPPTVR